jgi:hypothetical protein
MIIDSLKITHTGARGVLVIPVRATVDKTSEDNVAAGGLVDSVFASPDKGSGGSPPKGKDTVSEVDKAALRAMLMQKVLGGYTVTSHSATRAVINGPAGAMVVRDGEDVVISGIKCTVTIVPMGVILSSGKEKVELTFDRSLKLLDQATSDVNSGSAPAPSSGAAAAGSLLPPSLTDTVSP